MSRIYLAARYSRREELCKYRDMLQAQGHEVTSRWLNGKHQISDSGTPIGDDGEALVESGGGPKAIKLRIAFAQEDINDVVKADIMISFTEPPRSGASRGGRHVKFGYALELDKMLVVIGHRENLFHWLPQVWFFPSWDEFMVHFSRANTDPAL